MHVIGGNDSLSPCLRLSGFFLTQSGPFQFVGGVVKETVIVEGVKGVDCNI